MKVLQVNKFIIMKIFIVLLFNLVFAATGFICAKNTESSSNSPLPSTRPADIVFRYHVDGGMMYYSEELFISGDSCYYKINDGGAESKIYFRMTAAQLDKLYGVFRENRFDEIETYEEKVYDRGGNSISLSWGRSKYCNVSSSGMTFIDKSWNSEWSACLSAIDKIIAEEVPRQKKDFEIRLDKTLFSKEIYLQVNREVVIPKSTLMSETIMDKFISRIVKLSPGMHRLSMSLDNKYETLNISADSSKGIIFIFNDSTLTHTYIK